MLWVVSLWLCDDKLFIRPQHNIYTFFIILFDLFDLILYLSVKFVFEL